MAPLHGESCAAVSAYYVQQDRQLRTSPSSDAVQTRDLFFASENHLYRVDQDFVKPTDVGARAVAIDRETVSRRAVKQCLSCDRPAKMPKQRLIIRDICEFQLRK